MLSLICIVVVYLCVISYLSCCCLPVCCLLSVCLFIDLFAFSRPWPHVDLLLLLLLLLCRPVSVHPALRPAAGVRGEEPGRVHDGAASPAEDEEGLDAHRPPALRPLWGW